MILEYDTLLINAARIVTVTVTYTPANTVCTFILLYTLKALVVHIH